MKNIGLLLSALLLSGSIGFGQSTTKKPATTPSKSTTTKKTTTTKSSTTSNAAIQSANRTPTAKPAPTTRSTAATTPAPTSENATSGNKLQEMYDQYHGINQSKTNTATSPSNSKAKTRNTAATAQSTLSTKPTSNTDDIAGFRIGIRGGATYLLPLEPIEGATYETAIGYHGGLVLNFGRGAFSFQPEINYSQQKVKAGGSVALGSQQFRYSLTATDNRIEVPLLLKFSFGNSSATRFFVNVGPYGAYVLDRTVAGTVQGAVYNQKTTFDGSTGRISYGAAGGLGVALKLGPGHLTVEARGLYQIGDNSSAAITVPGTPDLNKVNRVLLQGSLGYLIPIGGR